MGKLPVIIDADPGIGSAVAIALALADPDVDVLAITACGGRTSGEQAFRNLQTIVSMIDPPRWPRLGFSSAPAAGRPESPERTGMLLNDGSHGLAECETIEALPHAPTESPKLLVDLVRERPGELALLSLGPLTNLNLAQERHGEFFNQLRSLTVLAGGLTGGNVTPAAEFNVHADPESARNVIGAALVKKLIPLETSTRLEFSFDQYDSLGIDPFTRLGRFLSKTLPYLFRENRSQLGREGILLPEIVALAAVTRPRLFESEAMRVDVEVAGELTRGMTVFDRRGARPRQANVDVFTDFDVIGVRDYLIQLVRTSATD